MEWIWILLGEVAGAVAAGHSMLYKRDPRSAWGWIAVCLMFPLFGAVLYVLFGVNRVRSRATRLLRHSPYAVEGQSTSGRSDVAAPGQAILPEYAAMSHLSYSLTKRPLLRGNRITMLENGENAYPAMLEIIGRAKNRVYLSTYIFESNQSGRKFVEALKEAENRGVDVKVLVDGVGEYYGLERIGSLLDKAGLRYARFIPPRIFPPSFSLNLRNHRKCLVIDSRYAFAGGMNIGDRHMVEMPGNRNRTQDVHFLFEGPIVAQLEEVFLWDWGFATREELAPGEVRLRPQGDAFCRSVIDGPESSLNRLALILTSAMALAKKRFWIMTPYFLPLGELTLALRAAALRGVDVRVVLPEANNNIFVDYAMRNMLWELLQEGVKVMYQPPPFCHAKLYLMDDYYSFVGSPNIDSRSLRLNFELVVEVYDKEFNSSLADYFEKKCKISRLVTQEEMDNRPLWQKLRDSFCWLFTPYL